LLEDDYLTELHQLQIAFKVEYMTENSGRGNWKAISGGKFVVYFYFYKPFLCPEGLRRTA
jgi:hypothetical protein